MRSGQLSAEFDHGARVVAPEVALAQTELAAFVVAVRYNRSGSHCFVATGDETLAVSPAGGGGGVSQTTRIALGALPVSLSPDSDAAHVLVGCDDGVLRRAGPDGSLATVASSGVGWIENAISHPLTGHRAWSVGKGVYVAGRDGTALAWFGGLESTPGGLCFSPDGGRLAAARYNGVTIWDLFTGATPRKLAWRGSHTAIAWSPNGRYLVTATQDRDLHCWRLDDGKDFRMSGYPSKIRSIGWTASSSYLCASGADTVTSWLCDEAGPGGKPALELGFVFNGTVMVVAPHPATEIVAAGYDDGSVLIGDIEAGDALIAKPPGGGAVSSLAWSPDGQALAVGTRNGTFAAIRLDGLVA